jgi:hypothetical protein
MPEPGPDQPNLQPLLSRAELSALPAQMEACVAHGSGHGPPPPRSWPREVRRQTAEPSPRR